MPAEPVTELVEEEADLGFKKLIVLRPLITSPKLEAFRKTKNPASRRSRPVFLIGYLTVVSLAWNLALTHDPRVPFSRCVNRRTAIIPRNIRAPNSRILTMKLDLSDIAQSLKT